MVHVALKLRSYILGQPTHKGLNDCKEDAIACVPESLYMFIRLMLGGQSLLENGLSDCDDVDKIEDSDVIDHDGVNYEDDDDYDEDDDEEVGIGVEGGLDEDNVAEGDEANQPNKRKKARL